MSNMRSLWSRRWVPSAARVGAAAGSLLLCGCWVTERYIATPEQRVQAAQVPAGDSDLTVLPVHRYKNVPGREVGKAVFLRASALVQGQDEPGLAVSPGPAVAVPDSGSTQVVLKSRRYSPVVTAGATLTGVGSIISVVGTIIYFTGSGDTNLAGGIVALSAEPMMLAGTLMWIFGILRPPQEVSAGRAGVRYLEAAPAVPAPLLSPPGPAAPLSTLPPAAALSLRF